MPPHGNITNMGLTEPGKKGGNLGKRQTKGIQEEKVPWRVLDPANGV